MRPATYERRWPVQRNATPGPREVKLHVIGEIPSSDTVLLALRGRFRERQCDGRKKHK